MKGFIQQNNIKRSLSCQNISDNICDVADHLYGCLLAGNLIAVCAWVSVTVLSAKFFHFIVLV